MSNVDKDFDERYDQAALLATDPLPGPLETSLTDWVEKWLVRQAAMAYLEKMNEIREAEDSVPCPKCDAMQTRGMIRCLSCGIDLRTGLPAGWSPPMPPVVTEHSTDPGVHPLHQAGRVAR